MRIIKASRLDKKSDFDDEIISHISIELEDVLVELDEDYELNYVDEDLPWSYSPDSEDGDWYDEETGNYIMGPDRVQLLILFMLEDEISGEPGVYRINGQFDIGYRVFKDGNAREDRDGNEIYDLSVEEIY